MEAETTADGQRNSAGRKEQPDTPSSIYDDVFRKIVQWYPEWFLSLINYVWGTQYPPETPIKVCRNEFIELDGKIITDVMNFVTCIVLEKCVL